MVRGGFGLFVASIGTQGINQPGFSQTTNVLGSVSTGGLRPAVTLDNPFPTGLQQPTGSTAGPGTFLGQGITFFNPHPQNPYSIRWNFDIQRQLGKDMVVEIGYTGNHAVHLPLDRRHERMFRRSIFSTSFFRDQPVIDRNSANVANPFANLLPGPNLNGATVGFTHSCGRSRSLPASPYHVPPPTRQLLLPRAADALREALLGRTAVLRRTFSGDGRWPATTS